MLKFLRKIRQKQLLENKFSKYFLYAIGEIILVVFGILIALQINNWNEGKKEAQKEYQVLLSLSEDFKANQIELNRTLKEIPLLTESLKTILSYVGTPNSELTQQMKDTIKNTGFVLTDIVDGTLKSILSSDKLELIKNDALKNKLTAYPAFIEKYKKQEVSVEEYVVNVQRFKLREYLTLVDFLTKDDPRYRNLKANVIPSNYEGLLKDRTYQNILIGVLLTSNRLLDSGKQLQVRTEGIQQLLEEALQRNPNYSN